MKEYARKARVEGRTIGFVPTMGALHTGHVALFERARLECSPALASIFVNPKQFGPNEDLAKYPRTLEADVERLSEAKADALFLPDAAEMYPRGFRTYVTVEELSDRLEGRTRPGHFRGVTTIVLKLLEIVQPHFAYFGRKDAQQVRIISQMARDLNLDTEIVICPTVRESDGLALSSRNTYLNAEERRAATVLHRALSAVRDRMIAGERNASRLQEILGRIIGTEPLARLDYAEIVDSDSFERIEYIGRAAYVVVAAFIGKTRLIDNMLVEPAAPATSDLTFHL
jgi:pantoate--beta-alanine ligase